MKKWASLLFYDSRLVIDKTLLTVFQTSLCIIKKIHLRYIYSNKTIKWSICNVYDLFLSFIRSIIMYVNCIINDNSEKEDYEIKKNMFDSFM